MRTTKITKIIVRAKKKAKNDVVLICKVSKSTRNKFSRWCRSKHSNPNRVLKEFVEECIS